jgi:poly-gamma-glutamate capsule biosynthesis protein CapA/YwtB (metallophosphatase superfamily)
LLPVDHLPGLDVAGRCRTLLDDDGVAERLVSDPRAPLLAPGVVDAAAEADLFVLNLECCISDRGGPIREPGKPFFFRARPLAAARLADLGVDCVTLANNHAMDFGAAALVDTLEHLRAASIETAGAGAGVVEARRPARLAASGTRPPGTAACCRTVAGSSADSPMRFST